jgi:hypothetical protein|tara:strand:+ start:1670 stop:1876 length:207 start_codon:yes stop_codon:yes gene_type:complete
MSQSFKKYTKKDFLDYATGFDYTFDLEQNKITNKNGNILSDDDYKKQMKYWKLKDFQEWFGFIYKEVM